MSASNFDPKSVYQQERRIARKQTDHSAGMFLDGPAHSVPQNGVRELKNFTNKGYLEGRGGCKRWSDVHLPNLFNSSGVERNYYTATKSGSVITVTAGGDFTASDIGNFFVWKDGISTGIDRLYRIDAVNVGAQTLTVNESTIAATSTSGCACMGPVNAINTHKTLQKIVLLIGTKIYVSDTTISAWTEAVCISFKHPSNSQSTFIEKDNYVLLVNGNGIYKVDLMKSPVLFFRMNSSVPVVKTRTFGYLGTEDYPYCRRIVYSMSRLSGVGTVDRETSGAVIECESGTVLYDPDNKDYGVCMTDKPISATTESQIKDLTVPVDNIYPLEAERHWTHYSVYGTLDVGILGFDTINKKANQTELYIWLYDAPICRAFELYIDAAGNFTLSQNVLQGIDKFSTLLSDDGTEYDIQTINSDFTTGTVFDHGFSSYTSGLRGPAGYVIGASDTIRITQSGNVVTWVGGTVVFAAGDVGKGLYCSNGKIKYITKILTANTVNVNDSETIAAPIYAAMNPTSRTVCDNTPDEVPGLRSRIRAWTLSQRAWDPMPACNVGAIAGAFLFVCQRQNKFIDYSEMPKGYEYLLGYHNSLDQRETFEDGIIDLKVHRESLIVRCYRSTHAINSTNFNSQTIADIGETHATIASRSVVDPNIGCFDWGGNAFMDKSTEMVITNEPGIRTFSGSAYGENLAKDHISNMLRAMQTAYASGYHPHLGYIFWGKIQV